MAHFDESEFILCFFEDFLIEIGLNKAIKYYISKNEETSIYQLISSATDKFANLCRNNLYTDSEKKLLSIAKDINSEFIIFYKNL